MNPLNPLNLNKLALFIKRNYLYSYKLNKKYEITIYYNL